MRLKEVMRIYHPMLGRFVWKHKRSRLIVDNIFQSPKSVANSVIKKFAKPLAKK